MKTLTATIFCYVFHFSLMSAQGIIHGSVMDSLTRDQLKGAEITLTGTTFNDVSNTDGEFRISGIPPGEYMLQASYLGYKGKKYLVNIKSEETLKLTIELLPMMTVEDQAVFTRQAGRQAEEMNRQISSTTIKNVSAGRTLQDMPDENIPVALSRLPGVSIIYGPTFPLSFSNWQSHVDSRNRGFSARISPDDDLSFANDPVSKVLIRGMDSQYSNMTIDGMRISPTSAKDKSVDLSTLSERGFQNIEIQKTITSDEEGDATAGAVNIMTGKAPSERTIKAELLGNDNVLDKSINQYQFNGNYGERFFDNLLGVQVDATAKKKIMSSEFHKKGNIPTFDHFKLLYTNAIRERNGAHIILDYSTLDGGSIKFNNLFYKTNTAYFESNEDSLMLRYPEYTFCERETDQNIVLSSLGGRNYLLGFDIDWNAAYSESKYDQPIYYTLTFFGSSNIPVSMNTPTYLDHTVESPSNNFCNEKTASLDIDKKYAISNELTGELKFGGKYRVDSRVFEEHLRGESGSTASTPYENGLSRRLADGSFVQKDFSGTRFDGLLSKSGGSIYLSYFQDNPPGHRILFNEDTLTLINNGALRLWHDLNYSPYYVENGTDINSYNFSESVVAGYIMHHLNFGQSAQFIFGLRIESEKNNYAGYYFPNAISDAATLYDSLPLPTNTNQYNKTSLLPNFHMILEPTDFLTLRLAAYKTLIRPDCNARIPKFFSLGQNSGSHILNMGNPDLKNADVWNYELQTQFYGNGIGQLSIHAFYKDIEGMVQETNGIQLSGADPLEPLGIHWSSYPVHYTFNKFDSYDVITYFNSPKPTRIWGFEIEHQANFRYLPGPFNNIILNYNLTFLRSETWTLEVENINAVMGNYSIVSYTKQKLYTMPEFLANVILGYDIKGFSCRISYFYQGECPIPGNYGFLPIQTEGNKFSRLDIALKQQLLNNVSIILNLNNITNSNEETLYRTSATQDSPPGAWEKAQAFRYGMNFDFGIGINL